ncbi:hypothetical protein Lser_V15G31363 [Lactuca serriola]
MQWFSVDENGKNQEMISLGSVIQWSPLDENGKNQQLVFTMTMKYPRPNDCDEISLPESRFGKVAMILIKSNLANIQVKIRAQFLSSDVTYAIYLLCKCKCSAFRPIIIRNLKYKINNQSQSYVSYAGDYKDGWMMIELFQTISVKRDFEFKFLLENFEFDKHDVLYEVLVEGVLFLPIHKCDAEKIKIQEEDNLLTYEIECENQLPDDYKKFLYYKDKMLEKKPRNCNIIETKEEAYLILSKGVNITVEEDIVV